MDNVYLIKVDSYNNNNKFYQMIDNHNGFFVVKYGRVGTEGQTHSYPIEQWDDKYYEKIRKGYTNKTSLMTEEVVDAPKTDNKLLEKLMGYSRNFVRHNYLSDTISNSQIEEAQNIIHNLVNCTSVYYFNDMLSDLFETIPRAMHKVRDMMAKSPADFVPIIEREQEMLDSLKKRAPKTVKRKGETITAESLGLEITEASDEEKQRVMNHIENSNKHRVVNVYKVINKATEERFNKFVKANKYDDKDIHFWYHGSKNQNWYGIVTEGNKLNPNAPITGKMFGYGLYTSPGRLQKSLGYTSLRDAYWTSQADDVGYVGVYKVAMRKPYNVDNTSYELQRATQSTMDKLGCDGVYAHGGNALRNDETIVYREEQMTIRYLLEIR